MTARAFGPGSSVTSRGHVVLRGLREPVVGERHVVPLLVDALGKRDSPCSGLFAHCNVCSMTGQSIDRRIRPGDLDELEVALLDRARGPRDGRRPRPARSGRARPAARSPGPSSTTASRPSSTAATSTTPPAGCAARGAGFYTIGSSGHEANAFVAGGAAADRPGAAALPLGRLLPGAVPPGAGPRRRPRRAPGPAGVLARTDRRWPPQGLRPCRPGRDPADVDHRLAPAAGARRGLRHRPRRAARADDGVARRTRSPCAASATPRSTTRRPRAR